MNETVVQPTLCSLCCAGFIAVSASSASVQTRRTDSARDEAIIAVIEFLAAFVLFLVIITAFFSLAQIRLGAYDPTIEATDRAAVDALARLTETEGVHIPFDAGENRDVENSTSEWHRMNATALAKGWTHPGISTELGQIDPERVKALANLTVDQAGRGLGLSKDHHLYLCIKVSQSPDPSRIGKEIFCGGATATNSHTSSMTKRTMRMGEETIELVLGVLDGGLSSKVIEISEILVSPSDGSPEWIEVRNRGAFALSLEYYGMMTLEGDGTWTGGRVGEYVLPGQKRALLTGQKASQEEGNASLVIDLGIQGWLGRGEGGKLGDNAGGVRLTFSNMATIELEPLETVRWGPGTAMTTAIGYDESLIPSQNGGWEISSSPTPGNP